MDLHTNKVVGKGWGGRMAPGFQCDHAQGVSELRAPESKVFFCNQPAQCGHALLNSSGGHGTFAVQRRSGRSRTRREWKKMQISKGLGGNEIIAFLEQRICFSGKADHHIRADARIGHQGMDTSKFFCVVPGAVAAMHPAQHGV